MSDKRSGYDDLSIYQMLVESRVLAFLVGSGGKLMSLLLEPFANTELVLSCTEKLWNLWVTA